MKLPNLKTTGAIRLIACGTLTSPAKISDARLNQERRLICSYLVAGEKHFARIMTGTFRGHFHIEAATMSFFKRAPQTNAKRKDLDDVIRQVVDEEIRVRLICDFVVPFSELPANAVIRLLSSETSAAGVSMRLTGGVLTLTGSPVEKVQWSLREDGKHVTVSVESRTTCAITDDYLVDLQRRSRSLFEIAVLGRAGTIHA